MDLLFVADTWDRILGVHMGRMYEYMEILFLSCSDVEGFRHHVDTATRALIMHILVNAHALFLHLCFSKIFKHQGSHVVHDMPRGWIVAMIQSQS